MQSFAGSEDILWQAILDRNPEFDGKLFYGVHSTRIYCRSTCPSRKPGRSQVSFFDSPSAAEAQGFRPCKRCQPQNAVAVNSVQAKVLAACRYIETQTERMPTLTDIAAEVGLSPGYFQRVFKQIVGVSPFQYADAHRIQRLKYQLRQGEAIAPALYGAGYGSSSRLYEKASEQLGMTPATYQRSGHGEEIGYTIVRSPLGYLLVAATGKGLCSVRLGNTITELENELRQEFCKAQLEADVDELNEWTQALMDYLNGEHPLPNLPYDVQATAFQRRVWEALRQIPIGTTAVYSEIASAIGQPKSVRAVARACATNPVALAIPCHRVVPKSGGVGGYRWGIDRKQALLDLEKHYLGR